ncbi:GNAT family N-acetyltransferase [Deinococcus yavapaiensis]|uniref:Diamine N-acetyltransferase n=1 Tax=Deinococcus yavapaiensis KR-236 TaxID=694435 RepID=A0A318SD56_9DEIO|nr:GNAT family N-acetyltransferase [Deinococcus yavapaiensis]PYE56583.1 diamine N-acetyltransferase [Deinococcus yavapaiensis KR-236]
MTSTVRQDTVRLTPVSRDNWEQVVRLRLPDEQRSFVAPNVYSLAEVQFLTNGTALAVYAGETLVGFVMYAFDEDDRQYWVYRLMIDEAHQRKGYARAAMHLVIEDLRARSDVSQLVLGYKPENVGAAKLYANLGFRETGEVIGGEVIARLHFGA